MRAKILRHIAGGKEFWCKGYPALMITDTSFYRNSHYHEASDTADRLDYKRMAQVVQAVYAAVIAVANTD